MKRYVVQLRYWLPPEPGHRDQADVLKTLWGPGYEHSFWTSAGLIVQARVRAPTPSEAVHAVDVRVQWLWPSVSATRLRLERSLARGSRLLVPAGRLRHVSPPGGPGDGHGGGQDDDGGLAGVREPRRPSPSPGHLSAELDLPRS